ncbi:N-acetylmuramoyl-L-alanine amidase [Actinomadura chibensis]|uniref:N-acetylmuramoyl-L-alanine amidase n=1 Tax=Actinomadura chibensis TaxID=392828 RepID=A0A5D0NMF6_9ACTN|nr:N-acetylmuramoyl-L-alanine amidase [Actinomadura chibensis]TYB45657.1 N-acetylmuramoyl-L-alanine amidase [Actinomadura chibensis]
MRIFGAAVLLCAGTALAACGGGGNGGSSSAPTTATSTVPPTALSGTPTGASPSLSGKTIVIDPGHNGGNAAHPEVIDKQVFIGNGYKPCNTTGTSTEQGYSEHAFTWDVANRLAAVLRARGAKVTLTRRNDTGVGPCVTTRAEIANRLRADAVVSIHADGAEPSGHGFHVIEPEPVGRNAAIVQPSGRLGTALRDAYRSGTGMPPATYVGRDGLDRRDDLGGLNMSTVPAVFIECGNMQNAGDAAKLSDAAFRQRMAGAMASGVGAFLH